MIPIVLHHGLMGFTDVSVGKLRLSYFHRIDRAIAERGHPLIITGVHPTSGIETRARQLKARILRELKKLHVDPRQKVIIIGHSMGGLDARYMISRLGMDDRVAALLTICTPHRGSAYADWCLLNLGKRLGGLRLMKLLNLDVDALSDLTTERCRQFNDEVPDAPGVRYFSIGASRPWHRVPPFAMHAHKIVSAAEGANDSLVSLKSARWGEYLTTWPADHWHTINHRWVFEIKQPTGDISPYWLRALDDLLHGMGVSPIYSKSPGRDARATAGTP